jgi:hypothetical protein
MMSISVSPGERSGIPKNKRSEYTGMTLPWRLMVPAMPFFVSGPVTSWTIGKTDWVMESGIAHRVSSTEKNNQCSMVDHQMIPHWC